MLRLAAPDLDAGVARRDDGAANRHACACHDHESGLGDDPGTPWTATADGRLPLGESRENTSFERDPHTRGDTAAWPCRGLRGRSRYPSQSENWVGLDGAWSTKAGEHA